MNKPPCQFRRLWRSVPMSHLLHPSDVTIQRFLILKSWGLTISVNKRFARIIFNHSTASLKAVLSKDLRCNQNFHQLYPRSIVLFLIQLFINFWLWEKWLIFYLLMFKKCFYDRPRFNVYTFFWAIIVSSQISVILL